MSALIHLDCPRCGRTHAADEPQNLCSCGTPLLVEYDLDLIRSTVTPEGVAERPKDMWRYQEFLPVRDPESVVSLGEGFTPLRRLNAGVWGFDDLWVKDEGLNPTGTFKARGASCGISRARELGIKEVALPTAGNAGGAWACYGAAGGLEVHVAMPRDAPQLNRLECEMFGAEVTLVDGLISDAARVAGEGVRREGWFDVSTLREPYRIEGKKTLGFEIAEQLGWRMPDAIICPVGGGVGIIGLWRALLQLREVGWVSGALPRLIAVQAEGCAPIVRAFDEGKAESEFWESPETFAVGLRVPKALGDFLVLRAVRETGGTAVAVTDAAIAEAMISLATYAGVLACPEGAATLAAALVLKEIGDLDSGERIVLINTGSGLKYPEALGRALEGGIYTP